MRSGYVEPQDRPLVWPYDDTPDDVYDRHEALDGAVRALRNDAAIMTYTLRTMPPIFPWQDAWISSNAKFDVSHDGEIVAARIEDSTGRTGPLLIEPLRLLVDYRDVVPRLLEGLVNAWVPTVIVPAPHSHRCEDHR